MQTPLASPRIAPATQDFMARPERKPETSEEREPFEDVLDSKNREMHARPHNSSPQEERPERPVRHPSPEAELETPLETTAPAALLDVQTLRPLHPTPLTEHLAHLSSAEPENFKDLHVQVSHVTAARPRSPQRVRLDTPTPDKTTSSKEKPDFSLEATAAEKAPEEAVHRTQNPHAPESETAESALEEPSLELAHNNLPKMEVADTQDVTPASEIPEVLPELPPILPNALHLEVKDAIGRWEMDVSRIGNEVFLEFQGDHSLRELVKESTQEISQRLSRHGDVVGAIHWRPLDTAQSSGQNQLEYSEPREQNQNSKGQNRQGSQKQQDPQSQSSLQSFSTLLDTL